MLIFGREALLLVLLRRLALELALDRTDVLEEMKCGSYDLSDPGRFVITVLMDDAELGRG